jgi:DNA-binding NarL/FixJ family response regulator
VLVCVDSLVLRAGLMATLERYEGLDCTEAKGPPPEAGFAAMPDVVVADPGRGITWVRATARMMGPRARPRVLIVTHAARECEIRAALSVGVRGYLLVEEAHDHLAAAIWAVRAEGRALSPKVAAHLAENVGADSLTHREEAVLALVIEGLCNKLIASRLGITAGTVKSHLRSAFDKLGAASRTQAVAIAHRRGLLQVPSSSFTTR